MNDFFALFFEFLFDYERDKELLDAVYNNGDYKSISFLMIVITILGLIAFYRIWDPISRQVLKFFCIIIAISVVQFFVSIYFLYNNNDLLNLMGNYSSESYHMAPKKFIMTMSVISLVYTILLSFLLSLILKNISTSNKHNPF
ncbi:hypothetical protein Q4595_11105 [Wenyingzhuangia sp. 1_MG-2023]|nr:hypothetical protein [Wenyingzhuangia sp. 1_MG-2023]